LHGSILKASQALPTRRRVVSVGVGLLLLGMLLPVLVFTVAVSPAASFAWVPILVLGALAWSRPGGFALRVIGAAAAAVLVAVTAVVPAATLVAVLATAGFVAVALAMGGTGALVRHQPLTLAGIALACIVVARALLQWPVTASLTIAVAAVVVLACRAPAYALWAGVLLIGLEGSIKLLLGLEHTPVPGGQRVVGAVAIDVALFGAVAGVLVSDRFRTLRALLSRASRWELIVMMLLGSWLALSVVQTVQGGDLTRGLQGFRLFQAYTGVALATAVVFAQPKLRRRAVTGTLAIGLVVTGYAAVRVIGGPSGAETTFARSVATVVSYGSALRAIGSFSSAVGLISFLAPMTAFAFVLGFFIPRRRRLAWTVGILGLVGLIGSYGRASLFGITLGLGCTLILFLAGSHISMRRKLVAFALACALALAAYGGVLIASKASPELEKRSQGILNPIADKSVQLRFGTWQKTLQDVANDPLGSGVGTVGSASGPNPGHVVTTDNSFLKVLREQGYLGFALFFCGIIGAVILLAARLRKVSSHSSAVGLAALAGFVTFLGISISGEYVEQPGKVIAWGLLGVAAAYAFGNAGDEHAPARAELT
jgi:hypothetical protein